MDAITMKLLLVLVCVVVRVKSQVTGTDPPDGSCLCMNDNSVNVRDTGCGTVIGQGNIGNCNVYSGAKEACDLDGVPYEYFEVTFGAGMGWIAGDFMDLSDASLCAPDAPYDPQPGDCSAVSIVTRAEWNARPSNPPVPPLPSTPVDMCFVHHTVTSHCDNEADCIAIVQSIQDYHMDGNGWSDIGYNFLVGEDGQAYEGRGWNKTGAHTYNYNEVAVAVSVIGDFTGSRPNDAALDAVRNVFNCAVQQGILSSSHEMFGHRDGGCTECPGDSLYAEIQTWPEYSFRDIPNYCPYKG